MKNSGGWFAEFSDYHSGSQQGHIRVPEGKKGKGWASFVGELRHFFLGIGTKSAIPACHSLANDEVIAGGRDLGRKPCSLLFGASQNLGEGVMNTAGITDNGRSSVFERLDFKKYKTTCVPLTVGGPLPTRKFEFHGNTSHKSLRISKEDGNKCTACWVDLLNERKAHYPELVKPNALGQHVPFSDD